MGCGSSRNNSVEEVVPGKIRPLFLRRYEEITKRRQRPAAAMQRESTHSKKKLLKEDEEDINNPNNSSDEAEAVYKPPAVTSPRKVEPSNKVAPLPDPDAEYETPTDAEKHNDTQKAEEETVAENYEREQVEEKNDNGDDDSDFGRLECPGSPSFRIYCLPPQINDKDESKSEAMVRHQKSSSVESAQSPKTPSVDTPRSATSSQNSKILNDCAETQSLSNKRRRNRRKRNFRLVKSLYASCSGGVDTSRLPPPKQ